MSANSAVTPTSAGRRVERRAGQVVELPEVVPPRVREVLVERDDAGVVRAGHDPAPALLEQPDADLAAELVVDVTTDAERQVDLLRLEPGDLPAKELERRVVVGPRRPEQLIVALVAAEDRVGQVEEHDRRLGEVGEPLVLEPASGHQVAGGRRIDDLVGVDGALGRQCRRRPAGRPATRCGCSPGDTTTSAARTAWRPGRRRTGWRRGGRPWPPRRGRGRRSASRRGCRCG